MSNCAVCHKPVTSGVVVHSECMELLKKTQQVDNKPLTIEELREMDGEPVYVYWNRRSWKMRDQWAFVCLELQGCKLASGGFVFFDQYGYWWLAYRRKPNDWISVKDRMPEDGDTVLCVYGGAVEMAVFCCGRNLDGTLEASPDFVEPTAYGYDAKMPGVTHWMPLPAPSEVGK